MKTLGINKFRGFFGVPGMGVIYRVRVPNCEGRSNS